MNDSNSRYVEALAKLYNGEKPNTCAREGCNTIILAGKTHCMKHSRPRKDQEIRHTPFRKGQR